jgi:hypothetical protein
MTDERNLPDETTPQWGALDRAHDVLVPGGYSRYLRTLPDAEITGRLEQRFGPQDETWTVGPLRDPATMSDRELLAALADAQQMMAARQTQAGVPYHE